MRTTAVRALRNARLAARQPGLLARHYATVRDPLHKDPVELDHITELPNGIRVATESLPGPFAGVGVYIDAGSRYEDESLRGVSHIVDRLAFKSTKTRSSDQMLEGLESLGGNIQCASSREALMYQSATFNSAVPDTIGLLADTIRNPQITEEEVLQQLETAQYEIQEIWSKPDLIIPELMHMAAYKDNTLGNPLLCPRERLDYINRDLIMKYRSTFYKPERIVVAFAGIEHDLAVRLTEKYFGDIPRTESSSSTLDQQPTTPADVPPSNSQYQNSQSSSASKFFSKLPGFSNFSTSAPHQATVSPLDPSLIQPAPTSILTQPSHYTGGYLALPPLPAPQNNLSIPLSHVHVAFEALPISSDDIYAQATLQTLLGGGGSFSAGGPGKGMYSRLYTNVLNQHGWVESCVAFNHSYTDSGLFGIAAACEPGRVGHMVDVMCRELQALTLDSGFPSLQVAEVNRAKNQLRFSLLMNLESRLVELEDLGRQVQVHGRKVGVKEMCDKIEALTVADLRRVARQIFTGKVDNKGHGTGAPTVVIQEGEDPSGRRIKQIPWEDVQSRIARWKLGRM
ncbi:Mitochondrial-processing peptidase subunit alpha [Exophiala xenobiotica]|uniref:Mitochondrial-processing peptidase subunit alpha n=1 Tax=Vermiconidia calcicola TaxID=1690605 RepID=A0AAV9Q277_9PEZI|nr:Mitochondrial-processing peptidase subunit alpha [Exophiala xenobiotica]KAK5531662.1 Mitochondrial-processing peptidase subunit alpha [Chaetothyriales sp. CCFEE 6169]KAK5532422.1 Mitochondrial-processing peptidase subunit alpha [Vermiconidia calcicola]KAK5200357.1 Mitochondrial-processing peptidase subunit alpha [Exophiala xenobiotica]KAK5206434.1 Mitochondrial-processing peptidase subunit alpha [Exophiala xenobiotica]